jgi:hypothetical protein
MGIEEGIRFVVTAMAAGDGDSLSSGEEISFDMPKNGQACLVGCLQSVAE